MDQRRRRNWWYLIGAGAAAAGAAYLLYQQYEREYQKAKRELDAGRVAVGKPVAQPRASPEPTPEPTLEPTPERPPAEPANRRNRPHVEDSGSADNARDAIDYAERRIQEEAAVREEENGTAGGADTACAQEAVQSMLYDQQVYSPLKDQYARYLAENRGAAHPNDLERYRQQYKIVATICHELERDPNNSEAVLSLLEKLINTGDQPPDLSSFAPY